MENNLMLLVGLLLFSTLAVGQTKSKIVVPPFKDEYSRYVLKLEQGDTTIDFQKFRFSFIESEQFLVATRKMKVIDSLKKEIYVQLENEAYPKIIDITQAILSIDYTDMMAHMILRKSYDKVADTVNGAKYKTIQFGLLNSIVDNGDGKSCATAWPVIQVTEEYYILDILDADVNKQSLITEGGLCDKMDVTIDKQKKVYYFDVKKVFDGYEKLMPSKK